MESSMWNVLWCSKSLIKKCALYVQILLSLVFLMCTLFLAVVSDVKRRWGKHGLIGIWNRFSHHTFNKPKILSVFEMAEEEGFELVEHRVKTSDGFILGIHRLKSRSTAAKSNQRPVVFLQHGLYQTSLPFILNDQNTSLAYILIEKGFDVWLGNNRGNIFSRQHVQLDPTDVKFWNWGLDELSLDVKAVIEYITHHTGVSQLTYVGHSQGCSQALIAFCRFPELQSKVNFFVALSPAAYVQEFQSSCMKILAWVYHNHKDTYHGIFGYGAFLPMMETVRQIVGARLFAYFAFCMFRYLMSWGDETWDKSKKPQYFAHTPAGTSTKTICHWIQLSLTNNLQAFDYGVDENTSYYGSSTPPPYDLSQIQIPTAIFYGKKDILLDFEKLARALPKCVFCLAIPHHEHLDNLIGKDAKDLVCKPILDLLTKQAAKYSTDSSKSVSPFQDESDDQLNFKIESSGPDGFDQECFTEATERSDSCSDDSCTLDVQFVAN